MRTAVVTAAGGRRRSLALAAVAGTTEADEHQGRGPVRATRRGASSSRCAAPYGQHLGGESARSHGREHTMAAPTIARAVLGSARRPWPALGQRLPASRKPRMPNGAWRRSR